MKKIVIFGGGSGLSQILKGLKLFPIEITSVVTVADNGKSTGRLRKEFSIPAVGDISKVLIAMSEIDNDITELLNYRFTASKTLGDHSIKNLLLTALLDIKGDFKHALPVMEELLNTKGRILPLTEENVDLIGRTINDKFIVGEAEITASKEQIIEILYNKKFKVNPDILEAIEEADLILISSGSLFTSILPHIIVKDIKNSINQSRTKVMYLSNLVTQPGETDGFQVSNHLKLIQQYINVDIVIANNTEIEPNVAEYYATKEQKDPVHLDIENIKKLNIEVIGDKIYTIEDDSLRHDSLKTAYLIFSYLMKNDDIYN